MPAALVPQAAAATTGAVASRRNNRSRCNPKNYIIGLMTNAGRAHDKSPPLWALMYFAKNTPTLIMLSE